MPGVWAENAWPMSAKTGKCPKSGGVSSGPRGDRLDYRAGRRTGVGDRSPIKMPDRHPWMQALDRRLGRYGEGIASRWNRRGGAEHPAKSSHVRGDRQITRFGASIGSGLHDFAAIGMASPRRVRAAGRVVGIVGAENSSGLKIAVLRGAQPQGKDNDGSQEIPQFGHGRRERVGGDMSIHPR